MEKTNQDLRDLAKAHHIYFWQIARKLGKSDSVLSRMMRDELSMEQKKMIRCIIYELSKEKTIKSC